MISDELRAANSAGAIATGLLALKIPVPLTTVQWADRHYYLPKESSYTPGRWETLPFQVAIMNSMGNDRIRTVNLIKSARVGYTKMLLGVEAYFIEHKSRNSLLFQPTDSAAEDFMKSHVEPTIRDVPVLLDLAPWFGRNWLLPILQVLFQICAAGQSRANPPVAGPYCLRNRTA